MAFDRSKITRSCIRQRLLCLTPPTERFPWDDIRKILPGCQRVATGQGTKLRRKFKSPEQGAPTLQTADDRQTDGWTVTYSERSLIKAVSPWAKLSCSSIALNRWIRTEYSLEQKAALSIIAWLKRNLATQVEQSRVIDRTERLYSNRLERIASIQVDVYLADFRSAASSATEPCCCSNIWTGQRAHNGNVPSSGFLAWQGMRERPSGRFPSERLRPWGSFETGVPAEAMARATRSCKVWCLAGKGKVR